MAVGLVVDYMVHIVHYFLHQVRVCQSKAFHFVFNENLCGAPFLYWGFYEGVSLTPVNKFAGTEIGAAKFDEKHSPRTESPPAEKQSRRTCEPTIGAGN